MAPVYEIFSGIQGEGVLVGVRQVFVRFCGCNRACRYCDTPEAREAAATCSIEQRPGSREFSRQPNPLSVEQVAQAVAALETFPGFHDSVGLTGGEPLLHAEFLAELCAALAEAGLAVYLETNGTLPDALQRVIRGVRHVAMDIKLESATGEPTPWDAHRRFLQIAAPGVQVKVVVAAGTTEAELRRVAELVAGVRELIAVVLQPVTPVGGVLPPSPGQLLAMQEALKRRLPDVRAIPQVHRLMGQK
jgi:organic radical activating enzyme